MQLGEEAATQSRSTLRKESILLVVLQETSVTLCQEWPVGVRGCRVFFTRCRLMLHAGCSHAMMPVLWMHDC
jgi:hypothetical protein